MDEGHPATDTMLGHRMMTRAVTESGRPPEQPQVKSMPMTGPPILSPGHEPPHIDDHLLGSTSAEVPLMWPLRPGTHRIVARDRHGHSAETTISVR